MEQVEKLNEMRKNKPELTENIITRTLALMFFIWLMYESNSPAWFLISATLISVLIIKLVRRIRKRFMLERESKELEDLLVKAFQEPIN